MSGRGGVSSRLAVLVQTKLYSRRTKDTVKYGVHINKLLELMGDELILLEKNKNKKHYLFEW